MEKIILDGKALSKQIEQELKTKTTIISKKLGFTPSLACIIVGNNEASKTYVRMKRKACERVGLESILVEMPEESTTEQVLEQIEKLNSDTKVCGIMLQHPAPKQINERVLFDAISPDKDVDGLNSTSLGKNVVKEQAFKCATPLGIMTMLDYYKIPLEGKKVAIIGRSDILGKPLFNLMLNENTLPVMLHSKVDKKALVDEVKSADIVVGALGKANFVKPEWVKDGAVLIDAGYNVDENGKTVGDIDPKAFEKASAYTPVPGGVGPMTVCSLISNTVKSCENLLSKQQESQKSQTTLDSYLK